MLQLPNLDSDDIARRQLRHPYRFRGRRLRQRPCIEWQPCICIASRLRGCERMHTAQCCALGVAIPTTSPLRHSICSSV
eukprot:4500025-Pleurochrysis_carterae.AAC.1